MKGDEWMKDVNLTEREYAVMKILWESGKPMLVSEIIPLTKNISVHTIHALLNSLMKKGLIKVVGSVKMVKVPSRLFYPTVSMSEFAMLKSEEVFSDNHKKFNVVEFMTHLIKSKKENKDEIIKELELFLDDYKKQIGENEGGKK